VCHASPLKKRTGPELVAFVSRALARLLFSSATSTQLPLEKLTELFRHEAALALIAGDLKAFMETRSLGAGKRHQHTMGCRCKVGTERQYAMAAALPQGKPTQQRLESAQRVRVSGRSSALCELNLADLRKLLDPYGPVAGSPLRMRTSGGGLVRLASGVRPPRLGMRAGAPCSARSPFPQASQIRGAVGQFDAAQLGAGPVEAV
jgi:hypothetical protein